MRTLAVLLVVAAYVSTWKRDRPIPCPYCDATGGQPGPLNGVGYRGAPRECPNCHGRGVFVPDSSCF